MTVFEAYQCFKEENPEVDIGKSKFSSLRPKWVLRSFDMPRNVCECKYHQNIIVLCEALHCLYPDTVPFYSEDVFVAKCKCNLEAESCMSDNCDKCE